MSAAIPRPTKPAGRRKIPRRVRRRCAAVLLAGVALAGVGALLGCAGARQSQGTGPPPKPLVWPAPPDPPRVAFVRAIGRPADVGVKATGFGRFTRWLTGSAKGNEPLVKPFGIALDEHDNLCLTDTGASAVCYFDRANVKWRRWDRVGKLRFASPVAVARRQGIFYVADPGRASVVVFDDAGKLLFQITNRLTHPSGLVLVGERLFVTDAHRHCVVSFDLRGRHLAEFGRRGSGPGEFNFPTHIAADGNGHLLVTDSMNGRVQILDADGRCLGQIGSLGDSPGHFSRPKGAAADALGHVYVIDALFDNLQVFDRAGRFLLHLGDAGSEPGQFWLPNGVAISRANEIFVTDSYNRRVQVFQYVGSP
jgi:DNA-binding beta-propeller fold protein YncE